MDQTYSTSTLAQRLKVDRETVRRYITQGRIKAGRTPGGHYRIPKAEFDRVVKAAANE